MENIIKEIKNNPLFYNMKEEEIMSVLKCGFATLENYTDNQMLFEKDQKVNKLGIVIEGVLNLVSQKYNGSRVIVTTLEKNDLFGEALIYASQGVSPYDLVSSAVYIIFLCYWLSPPPILCKRLKYFSLLHRFNHLIAMIT
jgi:signal-transduction protein with cAMP-binding, CBS, and nucleotidyltransferase domain